MKKISLTLVFGYGFVALVFVVLLTWFLHIFVPKVEGFNADQVPSKEKVVMDWSSNYARPYVTSEMDQPEFEGNFEGGMDTTILNKYEGGIGATKDAMNVALRQYPFDWSQAPPASKVFQEQNAIQLDKDNLVRNAERVPERIPDSYMADTQLNAAKLLDKDKSKVEPFADVDAGDKVLKEYRPKESTLVGKYDKKDSIDFIYQYYDKKGLIPEISEGDDGVYQILGYKDKKPKIMYEDEVDAQTKRSELMPLGGQGSEFEPTIQYAEKPWRADSQAGLKTVKTGISKEEKATSLERIFGPGLQWQQWG
jgi:hypothetical protein